MPGSSLLVRITSAVTFLVFIVLTALGGANLQSISSNSLPIPRVDQILGLALPLVQLLGTILLAYGFRPSDLLSPHSASERARQRRLVTITNFLFWLLSILDAALISTSAFALDPTLLDCGLEITWRHWYQDKNSVIRSIQDRFDCCGLRSPVNQAWPFPHGEINDRTCRERFGRTVSCLEPWQGSTRSALTTFAAIGATSLAIKIVIAVLYSVMQVDDIGSLFSSRAQRNDPARRRLLEEDERAEAPRVHEDNGVRNSTEWANA